jgi:hypothetical protein
LRAEAGAEVFPVVTAPALVVGACGGLLEGAVVGYLLAGL